jgi:pimeloyl-ACP methyl ester carboxylesterase
MTIPNATGARKYANSQPQSTQDTRTPPIGLHVAVSGRQIAFHRSGNGNPAVVFLPGAGMVGLDFLNIHEQIASFTTSVLYDRAGTGWSDLVTLPRSAAEVATELHEVLYEAGIPAPYVLVGHSLGGAYAQRFAQCFPDKVAGLLLLEPSCSGFFDDMPKPTSRDQIQGILASLRLLLHYKSFYRAMYVQNFAGWSKAVREPLIDWHMQNLTKTFQEWPRTDRTGMGKLLSELHDGGKLPDIPLIVLCALGVDPSMATMMSEAYLHRMNDGKRAAYTALAQSVPRGEYREIENAGHTFMHIDRPDRIMQAIRDVIARV